MEYVCLLLFLTSILMQIKRALCSRSKPTLDVGSHLYVSCW